MLKANTRYKIIGHKMNIYTGAKKSSTMRKVDKPKKKLGRPRKEPIPDSAPIPKKTVYNVLRAIMSQGDASKLAGFKDDGNGSRINDYEGTVTEIRERIQGDPRFGFLKQLNFYADVRDDQEIEPASRISAAKQLDTVAGYNAPQRVEIDNRHTLLAAMKVVHQVTGGLGMSPMQLKMALKNVPAVQQVLKELPPTRLGECVAQEVLESQVEQVNVPRETILEGVEA